MMRQTRDSRSPNPRDFSRVSATVAIRIASLGVALLLGVTGAPLLRAQEPAVRDTHSIGVAVSRTDTPPGSSGAEYRRAAHLYEVHRLAEARTILDALANTQPSTDVFLLLADVAKDQEDIATAMKSLKRAANLDPSREEAYLEFSELCSEHGNDELALESAEIGLNNIPDSYRLLVQKAVAQDKLGRMQEAEGTLRTALNRREDNSLALVSLAVVLTHAGRLQEAQETLRSALLRFPVNAYMHYYRGKLLMQMAGGSMARDGLWPEAMREFQQAIHYNPSHADSYYQLSTLYPSDEFQRAEEALLKCLKLDPHHTAAQYALARLYLRTGRKAQGEVLLARFKEVRRTAELHENKQLRVDAAQ